MSHALQLGKHRGAAIVGQPLNIAIQAVADSPEELAPGCVDAEVFYADNRVEKSRVRVTTEKDGNRQELTLRVRTTVAIDEPVVTIYLRTGCLQKIEKRYVVLADVLSESASSPAVALPAVPALTRSSTVTSITELSSLNLSGADAARKARRLERQARRAEQRAAAISLKSPAAGVESRKMPEQAAVLPGAAAALQGSKTGNKPAALRVKPDAAERTKARLKLEPLDLLAERDPALKSSTALLTVPTNDPAQRAAAAAMWRAIAAQPDDILNDSQKLKTLESAVSGLQLQMKKSQLDMQDLGGDIKKAQTEKYANPLIYGLGLFLLLALLALIVLFNKRRIIPESNLRSEPWWRKGAGQRVGWADSAEAIKSSTPSDTRSASSHGQIDQDSAFNTPSNLDLDLTEASGRPNQKLAVKNRADALVLNSQSADTVHGSDADRITGFRANFLQSAGMAGRSVKAEELFDVHQQADFFVSLGQKDQAIEVLRLHIEESEKTSALVYLDLLKLHHEQGERLEFEAFRLEFNARYNAEMPSFEDYNEAAMGEGLQGYPVAMSRIAALWPSEKVLTVLEESMFREPDSQTATFDLEAYRELLLLYAMMKDMLHSQTLGKGPTLEPATQRVTTQKPLRAGRSSLVGDDGSGGGNSNFAATAIVPLAATFERDEYAVDLDLDRPESLDVDLTDLANPAVDSNTREDKRRSLNAAQVQDFSKSASLVDRPTTDRESPALENSIDFDFDVPAGPGLTTKIPARSPDKKTSA